MIASDIKQTKIAQTLEIENDRIADNLEPEKSLNLDKAPSLKIDRDTSTDNNFLTNNPAQNRKSKIMDHLKQSSNNFQYTSTDFSQRNQKIKDHLKKSLA